jgi:hypothetical protein
MKAELVYKKGRDAIAAKRAKRIPEIVRKAREFIETDVWTTYNRAVPTVEALATHCGVSRNWVYEMPELADVLEKVQAMQANLSIERGLLNEYNPAIVKLLLSAKHGYVEKSQTENVNVNVEVGTPNADIATGFADYMKQKTIAPPTKIENAIDNKSDQA